ncbi:MAG: 4-hydroxy-tetrahydrodipicolinate reductase [Rikenellaceae bacterium]|nr:4-hydroxy-tetrahydrodipicolinate reductase [Rikenellaceae bacterium]
MKVALIGYGKMGKEIEKILLSKNHSVELIIDINNPEDFNSENLKKVDVAIEFSAPDAAYSNIVKCIECGTPVVCGTTAWLDKYEDVVKLCKEKNGAFFYASNYSIGVNVFFKINRELARLMNKFNEYDVTVEEVHHTQKKDAPSGTAITIAEGILENLDRKERWICGTTTEPNELEVCAIRRSVVPGIHTVTYESETDLITIDHNAKSRRGFAVGAVAAAEFLCGKTGIYTMDDLMNE